MKINWMMFTLMILCAMIGGAGIGALTASVLPYWLSGLALPMVVGIVVGILFSPSVLS